MRKWRQSRKCQCACSEPRRMSEHSRITLAGVTFFFIPNKGKCINENRAADVVDLTLMAAAKS